MKAYGMIAQAAATAATATRSPTTMTTQAHKRQSQQRYCVIEICKKHPAGVPDARARRR